MDCNKQLPKEKPFFPKRKKVFRERIYIFDKLN